MWSYRYFYLNIYKDEKLSSDAETSELMKYISTIPELKQKGKYEFQNIKSLPFMQVLILKADSLNS